MQDFIASGGGLFLKLFLSLLLGALIGWQREVAGREAGIRTFSFISMGSCLFGILSREILFPGDPGRIAAQVVSGIGFMGVGMIIRDGSGVRGLTTAATLWCTSAIGLAVAYGYFGLAFFTTFLGVILLFLPSTRLWTHIASKKK